MIKRNPNPLKSSNRRKQSRWETPWLRLMELLRNLSLRGRVDWNQTKTSSRIWIEIGSQTWTTLKEESQLLLALPLFKPVSNLKYSKTNLILRPTPNIDNASLIWTSERSRFQLWMMIMNKYLRKITLRKLQHNQAHSLPLSQLVWAWIQWRLTDQWEEVPWLKQ